MITNSPQTEFDQYFAKRYSRHFRLHTQYISIYNNSQKASRTQFPLQNSFSLITYKTQSLTLPFATLDLNQTFTSGQAYTAISRCPKWSHIQITNLNRSSFIVDPNVIKGYACLKQIASQPLPIL